ncbi:cbb3-type cytochrome c oxidase subunit III [Dyadobacter jejuensis]|uniref:Cbb3-type cytochrome c oxidase subunit III n=1 Tax=Dyadobacter jejuensis TaxID=1082580 RepID=A0A316AQZ0_9BACT|nr:cytochrome c [Dyadobacter jejuensis]PWJ60155.1 cbb3-type cytochrome c oxidase subunit III [Dyadobacter jejuensis]
MKLGKINNLIGWAFVLLVFVTACSKDPNDPGKEYAPNMYLPVGYEPFRQEKPNPINPMGITMRLPVEGTVARRNYTTQFGEGDSAQVDLMVYNIHADSIEVSSRVLKNPVPLNEKTLAEGKVLYDRYCQHCHGATGAGDGKVGGMYKGVPNYATDAYKNLNEGHIFHVITFGKARMWPHASQVTPEERWKIVHYVQKLQKGS